MSNLKRFACHRLYLAPGAYQGQSVVTLNESGEVVGFALLEEETRHTEWLGGVILLTSQKELPSENDFSVMLQKAFPCCTKEVPLYAWHLTPFDFEHECLLPGSVWRRLH